jgi:uncharacterized membrane protein
MLRSIDKQKNNKSLKEKMITLLLYLLLNLITLFIVFYAIVCFSNHATKFVSKYNSNKYILFTFHIYIICLLYFIYKQIQLPFPIPIVGEGPAIIILGPLLGATSNYFVPFVKGL